MVSLHNMIIWIFLTSKDSNILIPYATGTFTSVANVTGHFMQLHHGKGSWVGLSCKTAVGNGVMQTLPQFWLWFQPLQALFLMWNKSKPKSVPVLFGYISISIGLTILVNRFDSWIEFYFHNLKQFVSVH